MTRYCEIPRELVLGRRANRRVSMADQVRQRAEAEEILARLARQPGVILADEVGMGKTFVALAVAYCVGIASRRGPVVVMTPPSLIDKWVQDLDAFCSLYLDGVVAVPRQEWDPSANPANKIFRYGTARHSVEFLKLLDDPPRRRPHIVFLAAGAMSRSQTDIWVRLALIRETLRRHGRREQLRKVRPQIHRFLAELLYAKKWQQASRLGERIWRKLLDEDTRLWKDLFNEYLRDEWLRLDDDPVPAAVSRALGKVDLRELAGALSAMPVRARGGRERVAERITTVRRKIREVEEELWKEILAKARWRSPLLVLDEAHHLKNPRTALALQLQSADAQATLRTGAGALARAFDRMLFLTATPFQLGHHELVRVLERFGDVRWDREAFGAREDFKADLEKLGESLTASQRAAIRLQKQWSALGQEPLPEGKPIDDWWRELCARPPEALTHREKALREAYEQVKVEKSRAERRLRRWVIRHNKGEFWPQSAILRRKRLEGATIRDGAVRGGIEIPGGQLLPFFLAARSAAEPGKDLLGEALCSSYEAFRRTRREKKPGKDDSLEPAAELRLPETAWYLAEFDRTLASLSGAVHPKIQATVKRAADLWECGEKVIVFAFYRQTCRALRVHISRELEKRLLTHARRRLAGAGQQRDDAAIEKTIESIQDRFFDKADAPGRQALDRALRNLTARHEEALRQAGIDPEEIVDLMRRFLRVRTTLVRAFPIHLYRQLEPHLAVRSMLDSQDASGVSWRRKFEWFLEFLTARCSPQERRNYIDAVKELRTGQTRLQAAEGDEERDGGEKTATLASVQEATGETQRLTRERILRAFNTPFLPDILVCSRVMGEGVDLHLYCRHVIHHDLDWNPSSIEQRTGRVDRLGCKAEGRHPIHVYMPYLNGAADQRQYLVMTARESWFRIVMGQDDVARLIGDDTDTPGPEPPKAFQRELVFRLEIE